MLAFGLSIGGDDSGNGSSPRTRVQLPRHYPPPAQLSRTSIGENLSQDATAARLFVRLSVQVVYLFVRSIGLKGYLAVAAAKRSTRTTAVAAAATLIQLAGKFEFRTFAKFAHLLLVPLLREPPPPP